MKDMKEAAFTVYVENIQEKAEKAGVSVSDYLALRKSFYKTIEDKFDKEGKSDKPFDFC